MAAQCPYAEIPDLELADAMGRLAGGISAVQSELFTIAAEFDRRQAWRDDGVADLATWFRVRFGLAESTAKKWSRVMHDLRNLPQCAKAFAEGRLLPGPEADGQQPSYFGLMAEPLVAMSSSQVASDRDADGGKGKAELEGGHPIHPEIARRLCCDGRMETVIDDNLCVMCGRCHELFHEGGWTIEGNPNGRLTFRRPDGR